MFVSLVGAVAYALLTRLDIAVFVSCLQRMSHKCRIIHIKRLNAVVRYIQRKHVKLVYRNLPKGVKHLRCVGDAAFKKETDTGHALRGAVFLLCSVAGDHSVDGNDPHTYINKSCVHHVLEYVCKSEKHVTRSTFSAELFSACDTADQAIILAIELNEVFCGVTDKATNRQLREQGGWKIPVCIVVDAMNVFSAVTATYIKPPAEKSMLTHVQYLRELLDNGVLSAFAWCDTRDMIADGLTKGKVDRGALLAIMDGAWNLVHDMKIWTPRKIPISQ